MKKYYVRMSRYDVNAFIEEVEVERETEASVWLRGRRVSKMSAYSCYYDSWKDAHAALLMAQKSRVDSLRLQLERAKGFLGNIKGMKK